MVFGALIDSLSSEITASRSFDDLRRRIDSTVSKQFVGSLGQLLFERLFTADSLGRSVVVESDRTQSVKAKSLPARFTLDGFTVSHVGLHWIAAQNEDVNISFNLVPRSALDALRYRSFWVSGVEHQELLNAIKTYLERSLEEGLSYDDFRTKVRSIFDGYGVTGSNTYRLDTVFRTNLFSAYSLGQLEQAKGMSDRFPFWEYVAVRDSRTRPEHKDLDGKVFKNGEGPVPPIDYNCRCTPRFIHLLEAERRGLLEAIPKNLDGEKTLDRLERSNPGLVALDIQDDFAEWVKKKKAGLTPAMIKVIEEMLK